MQERSTQARHARQRADTQMTAMQTQRGASQRGAAQRQRSAHIARWQGRWAGYDRTTVVGLRGTTVDGGRGLRYHV